MTARLEVGHIQTLQAKLASGCLHFLKNCTQHTARQLVYLLSFFVPTLRQSPEQ